VNGAGGRGGGEGVERGFFLAVADEDEGSVGGAKSEEGGEEFAGLFGRDEFTREENHARGGGEAELRAEGDGCGVMRGGGGIKERSVDGVGREVHPGGGDAKCEKVIAVGRADGEEGGELCIEGPKRESGAEARLAAADEVGVAAKQQRDAMEPSPENDVKVAAIGVAEEEHGSRSKHGQTGGEGGIAQAVKMVAAGIVGGVGNELVRVTRQEVDVPFYGGAKLRISPGGDAEFPEVKNAQIEIVMGDKPAKPRAVILRGMREHHGEAVDGRGWNHAGAPSESGWRGARERRVS
jgi:hypothetical protein